MQRSTGSRAHLLAGAEEAGRRNAAAGRLLAMARSAQAECKVGCRHLEPWLRMLLLMMLPLLLLLLLLLLLNENAEDRGRRVLRHGKPSEPLQREAALKGFLIGAVCLPAC